jgi:WD40 repeat protein
MLPWKIVVGFLRLATFFALATITYISFPVPCSRADQAKPPNNYTRLFGATNFRHWNSVEAVTFAQRGDLIISCSRDKTIRIWLANSGLEAKRYHLTEQPLAMAVARDCAWLVAADKNNLWMLNWQLADSLQLLSNEQPALAQAGFDGSERPELAINVDGSLAAIGFACGEIRVFTLATKKEFARITAYRHKQTWSCPLAFSPDGRYLVFASKGNNIHVWDLARAKEVRVLEGHDREIGAVAVSMDSKTLMSSGSDKTVRLWEMATGKLRLRKQCEAECDCLAVSANGKRLAVAGRKFTTVFDFPELQVASQISSQMGGYVGLALSAEGSKLAACGENPAIDIWDVNAKKLMAFGEGHCGAVACIAISRSGDLLATASFDGTVRLWDPRTGLALQTLRGHDGKVWSVGLAEDGKTAAGAGQDGKVIVWDTKTGKTLGKLAHGKSASFVAFAQGGKVIVSYGSDNMLRWWDTLTLKEIGASYLKPVALERTRSADGSTFAFMDLDGEIAVWDLEKMKCVKELKGPEPRAEFAMALSGDGRLLAYVSKNDRRLWIVDLASETRRAIDLHRNIVEPSTLAFADKGKALIIGSDASKIWLIDLKSEKILDEWFGDGWPILALAAASDGEYFVTGNGDSTAALWRMKKKK